MKQRLSWLDRIFMGLTLFAVLFGSENLSLPAFLGYLAGQRLWLAVAGFLLGAVAIPVLGVAASAFSGGLSRLAGRVHPGFAVVFPALLYLVSGPCLSVPRAADAAYTMTALPFLGELAGKEARMIFSVLFFGASVLLAMRPERLTDRLGKVTAPCLLVLIALLFAGCVCWPVGQSGIAADGYAADPAGQGFAAGYQTMDILAAMCFCAVIGMSLRARGIRSDGALAKETIISGLIAGFLLALVYVSLAFMGNMGGLMLDGAEDGVQVITWVAESLYGRTGVLVLAGIFLIACLNVAAGMLGSSGAYFAELFPGVSARGWTVVSAVVGFILANADLAAVMDGFALAAETAYPLVLALVVLAFFDWWVGRFSLAYLGCAVFVLAQTVFSSWENAPAWIQAAASLPGAAAGRGWILPAVIGCGAGCLCSPVWDRFGPGKRKQARESG